MPKRKREDNEKSGGDDRAQKIRTSLFRAKIEQGNKSIASALKLARGFERQKLGRRQKSAKNDPKELLRLKEEVIALKALELGRTAEKYLFKQLAKTKRIKESSTFVAVYGAEPAVENPKPGAEANVVGRLFNSNPIKEVMPGVMKGIMECLGIEAVPGVAGGRRKGKAETSVNQKAAVKSKASREDEFEGFSTEQDKADDSLSRTPRNRAEDTSESEDDEMAAYDDRLASDSDMDSGSASSDTFQSPTKRPNGTNHRPLLAQDTSLSPSPPPPPVRKSSLKATKAAPKPSGTTTFLPALTMGGYYSGSDSDDGGAEYLESGKDPLLQKPRKNRRGQRARQEIAEKKHGKNANHLKKAAAVEGKSRDAGWDARRGATEAGGGGGRSRGSGNNKGGRVNSKRPTGANSDAVVGRREFGTGVKGRVESRTKENEGPLHPSWEAAKKRKEQGLGTTQAFSGKKITFD